MPTALIIFGMRVVIYSNDHRPSHVHVIGGGREAVFALRCPLGPPVLQENYGCSRNVLLKIEQALIVNLAGLCIAWRNIHGPY